MDTTTTLPTPSRWRKPLVPALEVVVGTRLGRYVVTGQLGRGGMGVVVRASDPKLGREVAIKVLHGRAWDGTTRDRLQREARAMAHLSHPNVVPVYDVGVHETLGPFVVMELVEGVTLRERAPAGWRDTIVLLLDAGRGLAAAHAQGLLHRDFKPRNVIVGPDGRARVTDFGLARAWHGEPSDLEEHASNGPLSEEFTAAGMIVGTPPYMAPEQLDGERVSPASDQYAFCVTAWELLVGARPFAGHGHDALLAKRKPPPAWPRGSDVPRRIAETIRRGLHPDPLYRWPDMPSLLAALQPAMKRQRLAWGVAAAALLAATAWSWLDDAPRCGDGTERIGEVWNATRRKQVDAAAIATGREHAPGTSTRVAGLLNTYAYAWSESYERACAAGDGTEFDRRMACLRSARSELAATVELLATADAEAIDRTDLLVDELPELERCDDAERLAAVAPPPPEDEAAVWTARGHLARARALHHAGRHAEAAGALDIVAAEARELDYGALTTEVLLLHADVQAKLGVYADAEAAFVEALRSALAVGQTKEALAAATALVRLVGVEQARADEGERHAQRAWSLLDANPDAAAEADLRAATGSLRGVQGRYDDAVAELERALALQQQVHGEQSMSAASGMMSLGQALMKAGRPEDAESQLRECLEIRLLALGVDHPEVTSARSSLANALFALGRYADAEAEQREVLKRYEAALGEAHPHVAGTRNNLGLALAAQGELEEAEAAHRSAIEAAREALGPEHPFVAGARTNLGAVLMKQGRAEEAEIEFRAALELRLRTRGSDHPLVAASHTNVALALAGQKRWPEAVTEYRAAIAAMLEALDEEHPDVALTRYDLGIALRSLGDRAGAEVELRRALAALLEAYGPGHAHVGRVQRELAVLGGDDAVSLAEDAFAAHASSDVALEERAMSGFVLARAIAANEPERADALADEALQRFVDLGDAWADEAEEVRAWLLHRNDGLRIDEQ